jgi:hypothetical protein
VVYLTRLVQAYIVIDVVYLEYLETEGRVLGLENEWNWLRIVSDAEY